MGAEHPCSRVELAQQLFKTDDIPRPCWARPHRPWLPGPQQRSRARDEDASQRDGRNRSVRQNPYRAGAMCLSQRQFGRDFQMLNPHKDIVVLRGWPGSSFSKEVIVISYFTASSVVRVS